MKSESRHSTVSIDPFHAAPRPPPPLLRFYRCIIVVTALAIASLLAGVALAVAGVLALVSPDSSLAALDRNVWNVEVDCDGGGNNELQCYVDSQENIDVRDGMLHITARRESDGRVTSGRLTTEGKVEIAYGRWEARLRVPGVLGTWPAFWTLGNDIGEVSWPACGEIDIMENFQRAPPDRSGESLYSTAHSAKHSWGTGTALPGGSSEPLDLTQFHTVRMDWSPDKLEFFVNGERTWFLDRSPGSTNYDWPYAKPHFALLNLAIGGNGVGYATPPDDAYPLTYSIDYVSIVALPPPPPSPPLPPWFKCGTAACTPGVWAAAAANSECTTCSCGDRIEWLQTSPDGPKMDEAAACAQVAGVEFSEACGGCDPASAAPSPTPSPSGPGSGGGVGARGVKCAIAAEYGRGSNNAQAAIEAGLLTAADLNGLNDWTDSGLMLKQWDDSSALCPPPAGSLDVRGGVEQWLTAMDTIFDPPTQVSSVCIEEAYYFAEHGFGGVAYENEVQASATTSEESASRVVDRFRSLCASPAPLASPSPSPPAETAPSPSPPAEGNSDDPRATRFGLMFAPDDSGDVRYEIDATQLVEWVGAPRASAPANAQDYCNGAGTSDAPCVWIINEDVPGCDSCRYDAGGVSFLPGSAIAVPASSITQWGSLTLPLQLDGMYWVTPTRPTEPLPDYTAPETGRVYRAAGEPPDPWAMNCFEVDGLAECNSDNSAAGWRLDIASNTAELYINAVDRIALTRGARRSFLGDLVDLKIEYDASRSNVFATLSRNAAASRNPAFYPCKGCCSNWPVPATATCETHWRTFARAEGF
ncbi:hypothetical protein EMIHUDRAFT_252048 [Emiliania huxleyi CCMP1516]|uniref:GH16 domain-containing protein n=2 Tax=Emiliania huxleyi TaxID=2903 RepID=A0A0D3KP90_EMIH1|nr:hypothetical protein EMIHUDRAFT_252048 [Emiliania huxleyi CCMP1516]EOD37575.1 hypothetical protein EMIHUDRAFT_252048 [Emiliania huxleyi CCMP1516]|eukprot:XP_005790004.1 hypothetical protein EMIHUDRAFT_252048 [Emiliania huxleyi CCMP1516]